MGAKVREAASPKSSPKQRTFEILNNLLFDYEQTVESPFPRERGLGIGCLSFILQPSKNTYGI
jgi:hypothetical protein